jgi:hypothetical protein
MDTEEGDLGVIYGITFIAFTLRDETLVRSVCIPTYIRT